MDREKEYLLGGAGWGGERAVKMMVREKTVCKTNRRPFVVKRQSVVRVATWLTLLRWLE